MPATPSIVWQPVPTLALRFAIHSSAPRVLQSAQTLFAPWIVEDCGDPIARRWHIEADNSVGEAADRYDVAAAGEDYLGAGEAPFPWRGRPLVELLTQIEFAAISHLIAHLPPEFVGLHGALLSREWDGVRRAVIVVGPKEAGKSTLSCALWRAGWRLHCDDFTLLDARGRAWPTARRVSLRPGSRALLGETLWQSAAQTPSARLSPQGILFHPHEIESPTRARIEPLTEPLEVGAICFLKRRDVATAPAQSAPLGGIEAALALLPYSNLLLEAGRVEFSSECANWGAQLAKIATFIADIPLYDVGRGEPAAMMREIERLISSA